MENKKKLVIVGDGDTGKTCLLTVFCKGIFPTDTEPTTFDQFTKDIEVDGVNFELGLWDTAGQEEYERLRPLSYADTDVILMCYSIIHPDSLDNIPEMWIPEVEYFCKNVPIVLVGTKKDLRNNPHMISELEKKGEQPLTYEDAEEKAKELNLYAFVETSALNNENVIEVFETACRATTMKKKKGGKGGGGKEGGGKGAVSKCVSRCEVM